MISAGGTCCDTKEAGDGLEASDQHWREQSQRHYPENSAQQLPEGCCLLCLPLNASLVLAQAQELSFRSRQA